MTTRIWLSVGLVTTLLAAGAWREVRRADRAAEADLQEAVVAVGSISKRVTLAGMIWPHQRAAVWPLAPGRITRVLVSRGALVEKGQPLAELDPWNAELEVARRRLALERAQARGEPNDLELSRLELRNAQRALANTVLRAPMTGTVIHAAAREGDVVVSGGGTAPPFIVADTSRFIAEVEGDEFEVASVSTGHRATVTLESARHAPMTGHVLENPILKRLAQGVSQGSVFGFSVAIDAPSAALQFGMVALVEIEVDRRDRVPILPLAAVTREGDRDLVHVKSAGRVVATPVTTGLSDLFVVEITSGIEPSATVVYGTPGAMRSTAGHARR